MHIPTKFKQRDPMAIASLIEQFPFATLVAGSAEEGAKLEAHHLPFILVNGPSKGLLRAHIARANPLWQSLPSGSEVLVIFQGPQHYVSPNYYPTKQEHGRAVPTWNYAVVHVRGTIEFVQDSQWLKDTLEQLTKQQEADQAEPWSMNDAPPDYIERLVNAVVGVEISITSMTGQWKLSQNQPEKNIAGVINGLKESADNNAQLMSTWVADNNPKSSA